MSSQLTVHRPNCICSASLKVVFLILTQIIKKEAFQKQYSAFRLYDQLNLSFLWHSGTEALVSSRLLFAFVWVRPYTVDCIVNVFSWCLGQSVNFKWLLSSPTRFILLSFWTADWCRIFGVSGNSARCAISGRVSISIPPVVWFAAVPNAFSTTRARQGEGRALRSRRKDLRMSLKQHLL